MTVTEFETALFQQLEALFSEREFRVLLPKKQFRRKTEGGFQNVIFSVTPYEDEYYIEVNLGTRSDMVESLAQQFLNHTCEYRKETNTVVFSIGKYKNMRHFRYKATNEEEDLRAISEQIGKFFKEEGFDLLNRLSNIKQLDFALNFDPKQSAKYIYNQQHRCFKGIIVAKLTGNPEFLWLVKQYRHFLQKTGAGDLTLCNYDRLSSYLMHYSVN